MYYIMYPSIHSIDRSVLVGVSGNGEGKNEAKHDMSLELSLHDMRV